MSFSTYIKTGAGVGLVTGFAASAYFGGAAKRMDSRPPILDFIYCCSLMVTYDKSKPPKKYAAAQSGPKS